MGVIFTHDLPEKTSLGSSSPAPPSWLPSCCINASPLSSSNSATACAATRCPVSRINMQAIDIERITAPIDAPRGQKFSAIGRQDNRKGAAFPYLRLHFDPPLVMLDDFLADGQPKASAF